MYLGIDIGTTSVKTVLIDGRQRVKATASAPLSVSRPHPGWSEQAPEAWWRACLKTLDQIKAERPKDMAAVEGIGLSGQQHGATLLDENNKPLRPAILWNDGRSALECTELEAAAPFREITGNAVMPGFTAPKLAWVRKHEPKIFARVRKVLLPKDYVRLKLTGEHVSDMSDSSGTCWLDVGNRRWSDTLLSATGLTMDQMPRLIEGTESSGMLRKELKTRFGMARAAAVAGGGGDNPASACGTGTVRPGTAFLSIGTSGVLFVSTERFAPNADRGVHAFCHAVPMTWHQMGVILSAAGSLEWLAQTLGRKAGNLVASLGPKVSGPSPVTFLPYLSGERTPHNDARIRGAFVGLSAETSERDLVHAVLDGVAFAFRDALEALKAAGSRVGEATAVGGGARSKTWLRIIASVLGVPLKMPAGGEIGAAFGAARLGLIAATGASPLDVCGLPRILATIEPNQALAKAYAQRFDTYRALYPALKEAMK